MKRREALIQLVCIMERASVCASVFHEYFSSVLINLEIEPKTVICESFLVFCIALADCSKIKSMNPSNRTYEISASSIFLFQFYF